MEIVNANEVFKWSEKTNNIKVRGEDINRVWELLEQSFKPGDWTTSKYIALKIIQIMKIDTNPDEIWGGSNRRTYLFPLIYNPLKYLAKESYIIFDKKGNVSRLK